MKPLKPSLRNLPDKQRAIFDVLLEGPKTDAEVEQALGKPKKWSRPFLLSLGSKGLADYDHELRWYVPDEARALVKEV